MIISNRLAYLYTNEDNITPLNEKDTLVHIKGNETNVCILGIYSYNVFTSLYTLNAIIDNEKTGVEKVQRNPNLALFGNGVLVGIIDTGIDYTHPAFLHNDGNSRIVSIWDQTIQSGTPPKGFTYGTEYNNAQINIALKNSNPHSIVPSVDENGHGTAIASIAAGSPDLDNDFTGIASSSELVVVKLKQAKSRTKALFFAPEEAVCYQESDMILGARYLIEVAKRLQRPLVLCIALGSSQSGHDGLGATSNYLSSINQMPQMGVVVAGGNEGNNQRHFYGALDGNSYIREFELKVSSKDKKFGLEIWGNQPSRLVIELITPMGESTHDIFPKLNECIKFDFINEISLVWVNNYIVEKETGDQLILIRLENPVEGIWKIRLRNLDQEPFSYHAWLPAGCLLSNETFFLESNPDVTITSPANAETMTVTAYNQQNDSFLIESGRGYTRLNKIKPDFAAPGFHLTCATLNGKYGTVTGTGAAAAYASGVVAMLLEWAITRGNYTSISGIEINNLLIRGANREKGISYPNNMWGYGKINIDGLFQKLRG
ncbi:S8 family peptidase [Lachnospiraceae bacterium LCP25S3_G4]